MEYSKLGRKLGIGTRVAARILKERAQKASSTVPPSSADVRPATLKKSVSANSNPADWQESRRATQAGVIRGVAAGGRGFGRGFWKPFSVAAKALWHQITGVFFAIFAVFFAQHAWTVRHAWWSGPDHRYFAIYLIVTVVFAYFSVTAFVRGRRSGS